MRMLQDTLDALAAADTALTAHLTMAHGDEHAAAAVEPPDLCATLQHIRRARRLPHADVDALAARAEAELAVELDL